MKGLSESVKPYIDIPGRLKFSTLVSEVMDDPRVNEENDDFRREVYEQRIGSLLNQFDFYSVGNDEYCHIALMTEEERDMKAASSEKTAKIYEEKAKRFRAGQSYINLKTMEIIFPEPVQANV